MTQAKTTTKKQTTTQKTTKKQTTPKTTTKKQKLWKGFKAGAGMAGKGAAFALGAVLIAAGTEKLRGE